MDVFGRELTAEERGKLSRWGEQDRNPSFQTVLGSGDPSRAPDWVNDPTKTVEVTRSEGDGINAGSVDAEVVSTNAAEQTSTDPSSSSSSSSRVGTTSSSGGLTVAASVLLALAAAIGLAIGGDST